MLKWQQECYLLMLTGKGKKGIEDPLVESQTMLSSSASTSAPLPGLCLGTSPPDMDSPSTSTSASSQQSSTLSGCRLAESNCKHDNGSNYKFLEVRKVGVPKHCIGPLIGLIGNNYI